MTFDEFAETNELARRIRSDARELGFAPVAPNWGTGGGGDEMGDCNAEVFLRYMQEGGKFPVERIVWGFDCIGFMGGDEAAGWVPVWMVASLYAMEVQRGHWENTMCWTDMAIERVLEAGLAPFRRETLREYLNVTGEPEDCEKVWAAFARFPWEGIVDPN